MTAWVITQGIDYMDAEEKVIGAEVMEVVVEGDCIVADEI